MSLEWELGMNSKLESKNCVEESLEEVAGWTTLVVVVSAPQLQLQFSTGNTAAAHLTHHLLTQSHFSTVKIALIVSCPNILKMFRLQRNVRNIAQRPLDNRICNSQGEELVSINNLY